MSQKENSQQFSNKWALLDTNILFQLTGEKRAEKFRPVFEFLQENNDEILITDATYFEFVGFAGNKKDYDFLRRWVGQFTTLTTAREDVDMATLLSNYYVHADPKLNRRQISYCDCLYAAQLAKRKGSVFIVTTDIHDYPISLFDIAETMVVEDGMRATIVAFITFNQTKITAVEQAFDKSEKKLPL